ncbi:ATP-dependent DNA ligase [Candidatus Dependentiae bacterium]|nr:MAG: ATP-dependent DNA ligase [Candidatus Dependentiae bacterium]
MGTIRLGRYVIKTSNEDKILFPKHKITKGELIDYYHRIGPIMVPYTKNRPISMVRYPDGIKEEGWYQKDAGEYFPKWIKTKPIKKQKDGYTNYVVINNVATLVYLANQACIAPHIWLSKIDKLNYPDRMIFDLDPSGKDFNMVRKGALLIKEKLDELALPSFVMTTGSRGVHIVVPLKRVHTFDWVRTFAYDLSTILIKHNPDLFTLEIRKVKRKELVFIDTLRNAFGQTGIAPYAVRPKPGAPVATPIEWKEVNNSRLRPNQYTIRNIFTRLDRIGDSWKGIDRHAVSLLKLRLK